MSGNPAEKVWKCPAEKVWNHPNATEKSQGKPAASGRRWQESGGVNPSTSTPICRWKFHNCSIHGRTRSSNGHGIIRVVKLFLHRPNFLDQISALEKHLNPDLAVKMEKWHCSIQMRKGDSFRKAGNNFLLKSKSSHLDNVLLNQLCHSLWKAKNELKLYLLTSIVKVNCFSKVWVGGEGDKAKWLPVPNEAQQRGTELSDATATKNDLRLHQLLNVFV